jgi:membrane protease YdiL (CAAX protease family)
MNTHEAKKYVSFFVLVFVLSTPFWILGAVAKDLTKILPIRLPISALMTVCPFFAAVIIINKENKIQGITRLLKGAFDCKKIRDKKWYIAIILMMPVTALLSYCILKYSDILNAKPDLPPVTVLIFSFVYFIGAIGEEVGWSGYVIHPLQHRYGAFKASIILGFVWAIWHLIPWSQAHQTTTWIIWQSICTIFLRVIMVWIFNNTGKSVFGIVLFHTMINISPYLILNYGSNYNPFIFAMLLFLAVLVVVFLWGSKTLARYRYTH